MFARSLVLVALASLGWIGVAMAAGHPGFPQDSDLIENNIVEQGPVYGGPHIVTTPTFETFHTRRARYPAMRQTYYYPTYRDSYLLPPWHKPWQNPRP